MKNMTGDIKNSIVKKPWGSEYICFENDNLAIWVLNIKQHQKTSLHCHPNKKTGYIVLEGVALVNFLEGREKLIPNEKMMIREGLFHQTTSAIELTLLEVETPKDKNDLVRFDDIYGRKDKDYETSDSYIQKTGNELHIPLEGKIYFKGYEFSIVNLTNEILNTCSDCDMIVTL